jgi:hypothetical protein
LKKFTKSRTLERNQQVQMSTFQIGSLDDEQPYQKHSDEPLLPAAANARRHTGGDNLLPIPT